MKHFSISEIFDQSWKLFSKNTVLLVGLALLVWSLGFINRYLAFLANHSIDPTLLALFTFTGFSLFMLIVLVYIGIIKIGLDLVDGEKPKTELLLGHVNLFWRFLAVSLISVAIFVASLLIPIGVGFFLALMLHKVSYVTLGFLGALPAIYLFLRFGFAPIALVDKNSKIVASFKHASKLSKNNKLSILGFFLVFVVFNMIGALAFGFGLLLTIPLTFLSYLLLYRKLA